MNSNLFHNIANVASLVLAGATAVLIASGCTTLPTGGLECSGSWINPVWTTYGVMALQGLKIAVNVVRDGFGGLTKPQPPVEQ